MTGEEYKWFMSDLLSLEKNANTSVYLFLIAWSLFAKWMVGFQRFMRKKRIKRDKIITDNWCHCRIEIKYQNNMHIWRLHKPLYSFSELIALLKVWCLWHDYALIYLYSSTVSFQWAEQRTTHLQTLTTIHTLVCI